ncbi:partner of Nob1 [Panicum miliaceum]|uniref:Partner of Nob1 n=1 Tax=Panicum miliaceum TaxID=4540 RepID=A0A3L6SLT9_PANMI|nr:partner of Nob1 [Panicum miliaceum]
MSGGRPQFRKVPVPQHRFAPLKRCWMEIYTPVYEHMKVDIRMNIKRAGRPLAEEGDAEGLRLAAVEGGRGPRRKRASGGRRMGARPPWFRWQSHGVATLTLEAF